MSPGNDAANMNTKNLQRTWRDQTQQLKTVFHAETRCKFEHKKDIGHGRYSHGASYNGLTHRNDYDFVWLNMQFAHLSGYMQSSLLRYCVCLRVSLKSETRTVYNAI